MFALACWCAAAAGGVTPDPEYAGPAFAEQVTPARSVGEWVRGKALIWAVQTGFGPVWVEKAFGPPAVVDQFRRGPVTWWYPELGVTASFPPQLLRPVGPVRRIHGGVH